MSRRRVTARIDYRPRDLIGFPPNLSTTASFSKTITEADMVMFAGISGDNNPVHLDAEYARGTQFGERIAHGMLTASLVSTVLSTKLPGIGVIYVSRTLRFLKPVYIGDTVTAIATIESYDPDRSRVTANTVCINQRGRRGPGRRGRSSVPAARSG